MGSLNEDTAPQSAAVQMEAHRNPLFRARGLLKLGHLTWLLLPVLLWWSLKDIPYLAVRQSLGQLKIWQLGALLTLNLAIILAISSRWWLILRANGFQLPFLRLSAYRLAGFALSYFTPGPQVGGEPLQVLLLTRRHQVPTAVAISSVFIDKLIELISNFAFLMLGLLVISAAGLAPGSVPGWVLPLIITILLGMTAHLALLWQGKKPFTWLAFYLSKKAPNQREVQTIYLSLQQTENEMMTLCRTRPRFLFESMGVSLLVWLGLLWEYQIMVRFVGLSLDLSQVILALTLARLAFLVPLPGGLGALEASQVLAMQLLGFSPAFGISLCLIIRARDLVLGGAGLGAWGLVARL